MSGNDVGKNKQEETYYLVTEKGERLTTEQGEAIIIRPGKPIVLPTAPELPEPEEEPVYRPMYHGPGLDSLAQISARETPERDAIVDTAVYTGSNYTFTLKEYSELIGAGLVGLRVSTQKLLDALVMDLTAKNTRGARPKTTTAIIDLEEYMRRCGKEINKSNKDKQRKKIKEDLEILYWLSLDWKEHTGNQAEGADKTGNKNFIKMRICSAIGIIKNGQIVVNFTPEIVNYLTQAYIMWYPGNLLKTDDRNPCAYHIGRKLLLHHSNPNNQHRGTANIISIKALLDCTKDIPSEAEVSGRHFYQCRIEPLLKALDALVEKEVLKKWELCNAKMKPLSKSQQDRKDYRATLDRYVFFEPIENKKLVQYITQPKQTKAEPKKRQSKKQGKD